MEWYSQNQIDTQLKPPDPILFWNTRGRAVMLYDHTQVKELLSQGFIRCDESVKPGQYNPLFDRGGVVSTKQHSVESSHKDGELELTRV